MKYCIEPMNIKETWNSILTGCATLKRWGGVCFYAACLYSKHEQEETALLIDRRFHFVPMDRFVRIRHKHAVLLNKSMFFFRRSHPHLQKIKNHAFPPEPPLKNYRENKKETQKTKYP
jgi:hypothetical protein